MKRDIHLRWSGPHTWAEVPTFTDNTDYGIYQIYGCHPVYGADTLLYIGMAERQTFSTRLQQEKHWVWQQDFGRLQIYLGRLAHPKGTPEDSEWGLQIKIAEKLLIVSHLPSFNSQINIDRDDPHLQSAHVFNWECYRSLMPEVSGFRWTSIHEDIGNYMIYDISSLRRHQAVEQGAAANP